MPEYLSPGVYIEEISGIRPIEGVGTSTAGFIGATERGPEAPRLITSFLDFQRWYGSFVPAQSFLAYSVQGFFENGGQRCFVARITSRDAVNNGANAAAPTSTNLATVNGNDTLTVSAIGPGEWGNRIIVKLDRLNVPQAHQDWFRLTIMYYRPGRLTPPAGQPSVIDPNGNLVTNKAVDPHWVDPTSSHPDDVNDPQRRTWEPDHLEVFDGLTHEPNASNNVLRVVNANSRLVRVWWTGNPASMATPDAFTLGNTVRNNVLLNPRLLGANGTDGAAITPADFTGDTLPLTLPGGPPDLVGAGRGLEGLAAIDEIALLIAPDAIPNSPLAQVLTDVINQCVRLKDRFAIAASEQGVLGIENLRPPMDTSYAAFYYPWIRVYDPSTNAERLVPPAGHVAGIYARTDIERGVHKAPANEVIRGISLGNPMEFPVTKGMQDILNPRGVNCIRDFRADRRGIRVWGARTMSSDGEWKYVNVRRLFIYVEESIDEGTQWVVFEPNDENTWAKVRRSISNFLIRVWRSGALMGATAEEAFFVKCDRSTMTEDDIANGRLICYIGLAPVKPAEFVIFRFSQKTAEAEA